MKTTIVILVVLILSSKPVSGQESTSQNYAVTVREVILAERLTVNHPVKNRVDEAPSGQKFLIVDFMVQMLDPQLGSRFLNATYPDGTSILKMASVRNDSGEVFPAVGGGFNADATCACDMSVAKRPGRNSLLLVLHFFPPATIFRDLRPNMLFDGRLVFAVTDALAGKRLRLQFEDVQVEIAPTAGK